MIKGIYEIFGTFLFIIYSAGHKLMRKCFLEPQCPHLHRFHWQTPYADTMYIYGHCLHMLILSSINISEFMVDAWSGGKMSVANVSTMAEC